MARRVLQQLRERRDCATDEELAKDYGREFDAAERQYVLWLRQRLSGSTLAAQLAAGPDLIPDIAEGREGMLPQLLRLFRPRTLEQYINYLVTNLDWLLEPARKPDWRSQVNWSMVAGLAIVMMMAYYVVDNPALRTAITLLGAAGLLVAHYAAMGRDKQGCRLNLKRFIHATELYIYLQQAYSDAPADGGADQTT